MSELLSNYFDKSAEQDAYQNAINQATGAESLSAKKYQQELRKNEEENEKADRKYDTVKEIATTFGVVPLTEGVRDAVSKLSKEATTKVSKAVHNKVADLGKQAYNKTDEMATEKTNETIGNPVDTVKGSNIKDVADLSKKDIQNVRNADIGGLDETRNLSRGLNPSQLPENYLGMPKPNVEGVEENIARRRKLAVLKAQTERKYGKFNLADNIEDANNLNDSLGEESLARSRQLTSRPRLEPVTLSHEDYEDIDPSRFFQESKGFQPTGELTNKSYNNPFSIMNDPEALKGARDFKEFSSLGARKEALTKSLTSKPTDFGDANIIRAPSSTKAIIPKAKIGDQLQPMRDMVSSNTEYENAKALAQQKANEIRIKEQLPDVDDLGKLSQKQKETEIEESTAEPIKVPPQEVANPIYDPHDKIPTEDSLGEENSVPQTTAKARSPNDLGIGENTGGDASGNTSVVADAGQKESLGMENADVAKQAGEDAGKSIGKIIEDGAIEGAEIDAEAGGPESVAGDLLAGAIGVGSILGGILHHHKHAPEPPAPPPPRILNPAPTLGL